MKKKTDRLGEIINGERKLRSHRRFITPYYHIRKGSDILRYGSFLVVLLWHILASPPTPVYVAVLTLFFGGLALDVAWFDSRDHRVYIRDSEVILKANVALIRYNWSDIERVTRLPDNAIAVTFTDKSEATLKGLRSVDELMPLFEKHVTGKTFDE
jgi:hypothetical protein